jgi:uncharacterized protein YceK
MRVIQIFTLSVLLVFISGCSSFQSNLGSKHRDENGIPPSQLGYPYSGLTSYSGSWCYFTSPIMDKTHVKFVVAPIIFVFLIVDLPLTVVTDTVLLPFELFIDPKSPRVSIEDECRYSSK